MTTGPGSESVPTRTTCFYFRWLFCRGVALTYLAALLSLWVQVDGLMGRNGIVPFPFFLDHVYGYYKSDAWSLVPTLFWLNQSDAFMHALLAIGSITALLALAGILQPICFLLLWAIYLSFQSVGAPFLNFQWDLLLLEAGLLAVFLAPMQLVPKPSRERLPSTLMLWLVRLLLFRLMLSSGFVKLADPTWTELRALLFHYETQPLPSPIAWYAHNLPAWFNKLSVAVMFVIELVVPFGIFATRRIRCVAGLLMGLLIMLIALTGNYAFFNFLTMLLCLSLIDDVQLQSLVSRKPWHVLHRLPDSTPALWLHFPPGPFPPDWATAALRIVIAAIIVPLGGLMFIATLTRGSDAADHIHRLTSFAAPYRSVNTYGLFAHMTTERPEIVIEGSDDGIEWKPYEFRYKPGALGKRPKWVAPHQPRLDWQMWFAALGTAGENQWVRNLMLRLLQGKPEVVALLEHNPFPESPPRFIRATRYRYHFTNWNEYRKSGNWWTREWLGTYTPPVSLTPSPE